MIHACPQREWYVTGYLIPQMVAQGIDPNNIEVWMDSDHDGNLLACMKCFTECGKRGGGRWHLQDDVVLSHDFKEKTEAYDDGIVSGFCHAEWQDLSPRSGVVPAVYHWNSFQCIRIPDNLAGGCAEWFFNEAIYSDHYRDWVKTGKMDDTFWRDYLRQESGVEFVTNLKPSIVDHIDFLLGGSVINRQRETEARATWWEDEKSIETLKRHLSN